MLLILGTQAKVGHLDCIEIIWVAYQNIIWFQVPMDYLICVQVVNSLEDCLDDLRCLFIREIDTLALLRYDELRELASAHELHSKEDFALDFLELAHRDRCE